MSDYIFLFDLDSTITKEEILPKISNKIGKHKEMKELTEATMRGELQFKNSFLNRVEILKNISVAEINEIVKNVLLNEAIANFIWNNKERCYIVTGNLDVWINKLIIRLGMENHVYSSKAQVLNDKIFKVTSVMNKELIVKQFIKPIVVIGDGDNDVGMAKHADIAIGFGGVRPIAKSLLENVDYVFYDDKECANFLNKLL